MKRKMIRQKGFSKQLAAILKKHSNERISQLDEDDIDEIISEFWSLIATMLKNGVYISFEGWISFFTKPIQRRCHNPHDGESWMTYKRRIRTKILDRFRKEGETELSESEIEKLIKNK